MNTKTADMIYDLLIGERESAGNTLAVENMFAEGRTCEELYNNVYEANIRLCDRLGFKRILM